jgi:hypothetical protein
MTFPALNGETDAIQRQYAREAFGELIEFKVGHR